MMEATAPFLQRITMVELVSYCGMASMVPLTLQAMVSNSPAREVSRLNSWETDSMVMPQASFGSVRQELPYTALFLP
jgi:hypothetical protein